MQFKFQNIKTTSYVMVQYNIKWNISNHLFYFSIFIIKLQMRKDYWWFAAQRSKSKTIQKSSTGVCKFELFYFKFEFGYLNFLDLINCI